MTALDAIDSRKSICLECWSSYIYSHLSLAFLRIGRCPCYTSQKSIRKPGMTYWKLTCEILLFSIDAM